jgi:hypothetical protein
MQLDFQFNGTRYMLNFDDYLCKEYAEKGIKSVELRVYHSLKSDSLYASSLRLIEQRKIVWNPVHDNAYIPKEARDYCDRVIQMAVFA